MKTVDFSETVAASGLKGSRSRHLIEYIKKKKNVYFVSIGLLALEHDIYK